MTCRICVISAVALVALGIVAPAGVSDEPGETAGLPTYLWERDPSRTLTAAEAEKLVADIVVLLNKDAAVSERRRAVEVIWGTRHRAAVSALRFVAHNEGDEGYVRQSVVRPLLFIGLKDAMGDLIKLLRSADRDVGFSAYELLLGQHPEGKAFAYVPWESVEDNEAAIRRWEEWWEANKDTFEVKIGPLLGYD